MRPEDSDPARVWDMVHWGRRLARMIEGVTWDAYREDEVLQVAVERCIEVIGEAARHLSEDFKARHPDIPWRNIVQQRNVITHGYFFLEHERLWDVTSDKVPKLVLRLQAICEPPGR